jgi:formylglycine-generating enzyme required for sulfatase activity
MRELDRLREQLSAIPDKDNLRAEFAQAEARLNATHDEQIAAQRDQQPARRTWRFASAEDEWWHTQLVELDSELAWLDSMRATARAATTSDRAKLLWSEAITAIAQSPKYQGAKWPSGARLTPQSGLLPLGENPATGLWEFVHLQSGTEPTLGADGRVLRDKHGNLLMTPEAGMVLVLLPGGRVPKADSPSQKQPEWITSVELAPFFLSKYELTAEQWDRLSLRQGHSYTGGQALTPANIISWEDIALMWPRELGWCDFPSEMQWEFGCRAGTSSTWWTGEDTGRLRTAANLAGSVGPVGSRLANAFGLHDVHGGVWEWCGDTFDTDTPPRPGDGLREDGIEGSTYRSYRGGSWHNNAAQSASSFRNNAPPGRSMIDGLRPARRITP